MNEQIQLLLNHSDPAVRGAATKIKEHYDRRTRILQLVQEALSQIRLEVKSMAFDLECTRQERDEALGKA